MPEAPSNGLLPLEVAKNLLENIRGLLVSDDDLAHDDLDAHLVILASGPLTLVLSLLGRAGAGAVVHNGHDGGKEQGILGLGSGGSEQGSNNSRSASTSNDLTAVRRQAHLRQHNKLMMRREVSQAC
jgi:hypothetical protein